MGRGKTLTVRCIAGVFLLVYGADAALMEVCFLDYAMRFDILEDLCEGQHDITSRVCVHFVFL